MIVDQDAHPPHHLPNRSRHGSGTACHDRQALVPPWTPLAHAVAHSCSDGHQAQPEGLETIPSRSAQCWHLPREARSRLERSVEASIAHVSRAAGCHMAVSALAATPRDQTSGGDLLRRSVGETRIHQKFSSSDWTVRGPSYGHGSVWACCAAAARPPTCGVFVLPAAALRAA